jgi:hypothetical protein
MIDGIYLGGYRFTGNEQLQLTFTSSLSGAVQVDVYAYVHSAVEYSASGVRKISL